MITGFFMPFSACLQTKKDEQYTKKNGEKRNGI
jgi:hypothetical protein